MTPPRIRLRNVRKTYGELVAVDDVSFDVGQGEILVLLGASGCGKTTTLRLVAGLERPDSGEIALSGEIVAGPRTWVQPEARRIGLVFQDYALFPHLSVEKNIAFGLNQYNGDKRARITDMLALVGLAGLGKRMPHELSGGQQQRVALARALAPGPDVLLLDEPFSNLDAALRAQVRGEVRDILRQTGVTSVFVTHDQEEALSIADRVAVLHAGALEQIASPQDIYTRPATRHVAAFVGEAVFLPGIADGVHAESPLGPVTLTHAADGPVDLMLRPEAIHIDADTAATNHRATVQSVEFYGHDQRVELQLDDDQMILSRMNAWHTFQPGQRVAVRIVHTAQPFEKIDSPVR